MITIKGREVSEDTIALALMQYFTEHPEKYIFQAGDVVENQDGNKRIIVSFSGSRLSFSPNGRVESRCQEQFKKYGYRKIGVLSEYIK